MFLACKSGRKARLAIQIRSMSPLERVTLLNQLRELRWSFYDLITYKFQSKLGGVLGKFSNFELRVAPNACAIISRLNRARITFRLYLLRLVFSKQLKQRVIRGSDPDKVIEMLFITH